MMTAAERAAVADLLLEAEVATKLDLFASPSTPRTMRLIAGARARFDRIRAALGFPPSPGWDLKNSVNVGAAAE